MARQRLDKETRRTIINARRMIEDVAKADGNEAETRRRVERIFESVMGYDVFKHISREHAVRGAGETEHCDFAIQVDPGEDARPVMMVELKRVNVDLAPKHLKQVASYAIDAGCEWILLTNARDWRLYHVTFDRPPETKLLRSWDLLHDDPAALAEHFALIAYRNVRKGGLDQLWQKANVLTRSNVLGSILAVSSIKHIRRELKKLTGVFVTPEEVVGSIRRLLNEAAIAEMQNVRISLPGRKRRGRKRAPQAAAEAESQTDERGAEPEETDDSPSDDTTRPQTGTQAPPEGETPQP